MSNSNNNSTIQVSVDASGFEAGVNKIKAGSATIAAAQDAIAKRAALVDAAMAEAAANGFELNARAANKLASEFQRLADTAGKTQAQILAQRAANTGVTSTFASLGAEIEAASEHTHGFSLATSAAKRELLVMGHELTQGNYKKFGGSLLVFGEQTGAASLLFSAAGLSALGLAAAVAGLGKAAYDGAEDAKAFNAALVLTNNYAGLTAQSVQNMAAHVSALSGVSFGKADEAVRSLAASGLYTSSEMEGLANVIVRTAAISGESLDDVAKRYEGLAQDPGKWAAEHDKSMHLMDTATFQHIQALDDAGNKHAAVQTIIDAATAQVETSSTAHLSAAGAAWHSLGNEVSTFWAKLKQGLSTGASLQDRIDTLMGEKSGLPDNSLTKGYQKQLDQQIALLQEQQRFERQSADSQAHLAAVNEAGVAAAQRLEKLKDTVLTNEQRRNKELTQLAKDRASILAGGGAFSDQEYSTLAAGIQSKYKDPKQHTASNSGAINAQLAIIAGQNKLIEQEEKRSEAALKAQRDSGLIDNESYLTQLNTLQTAALNKEIALAQQRADIAGGKKEKAAQQSYLATVKELTAQRDSLDKTLIDNLAKYDAQRTANVQKYADQEASVLRKQEATYAGVFATRFLDANQKSDYDARSKLLNDYENQVATLKQQYESPTADKLELAKKLAIAQDGFAAQRDALETNLKQQQQLRDSYGEQVHLALYQLAGTAQTNAQLFGDAFKTTFTDLSSALDTFVTTGKFSFNSFASSIIGDLAKIALHATESQIFNSVAGASFFSTGGSVGKFATGGNISGPGTGTSDSIPALLSNGEYVINAASTKKYGSLLDSINSGHLSKFASGGAVGNVTPAGPVGSGTTLNLALSGNGGGLTRADLMAMAPDIQTLIDKRLNKRMTGQGGFADMIRNNRI